MTHVEGEVDPIRDFDIITEELRLKDEENLLKNLDKLERACIRGNDKKLKPEYVSRKYLFLSFTKSIYFNFIFRIVIIESSPLPFIV